MTPSFPFHEGSSEFDEFQAAGGGGGLPPPAESSEILFPSPEHHSWHFLKNFRKFFWIFWKIFFGIDRKFFWDRSNFFNGFSNFLKFAPNNFCRNYKEKIFQIFFPKNGFLSDYMVLGSQKNIFGKLRSFLKISEKIFFLKFFLGGSNGNWLKVPNVKISSAVG